MSQEHGTLRIYGAGGTGVNIASYFNNASKEPNCADLKVCYIDTSRSNIDSNMNDEDIFVLPGVNGSGKFRAENAGDIDNVTKKIVLDYPPENFNVVVFSASGGSGSVIGPLIMRELLSRGESAVAVVIGGDESVIEANNTLNTLKTLEAISQKADKPLVMYYEHNEGKRSAIDSQVQLAISALAVLASQENKHLDSMDISNWLNFSKTTTVQPQLAQLEIYVDAETANKVQDPISVVSIYEDADQDTLKSVPEYAAVGYLSSKPDRFDQFHYLISIDQVSNIASTIQSTLSEYQTRRDSRVKQGSIVSKGDSVSDNGLILG